LFLNINIFKRTCCFHFDFEIAAAIAATAAISTTSSIALQSDFGIHLHPHSHQLHPLYSPLNHIHSANYHFRP
jgi:hypothetical protein